MRPKTTCSALMIGEAQEAGIVGLVKAVGSGSSNADER